MGFIQNSTKKKQFKENLDSIKLVYGKARECLIPANNVYWHFNLRTHSEDLNVTKKDISISLTTLLNYINQIKNLSEYINKQYSFNAKLFTKFSENVKETNLYINKINKDILILMENLKRIPEYREVDILKYLYKQLDNIQHQLFPILKNRIQKVEVSALA